MEATTGYVRASVAARWCGVCPKTIIRWVRAGHVPGTRIGRRWYVARADAIALRDASREAGPLDEAVTSHVTPVDGTV